MKTPSPLLPQSSLSQKALKGAASVRIWVVSIIAVHVLFFGLLLMQGCKRDNRPAETDTNTNVLSLPPFDAGTNLYSSSSNSATIGGAGDPTLGNAATSAPPIGVTGGPIPLGSVPPIVDPSLIPVPTVKEYAVQQGDILAKIAKDHGISLNLLVKANPNLDPRRLKIGQKLSIPAPEPTAGPGELLPGITSDSSAASSAVHVVKLGDTLTSIAKKHHTTVAAIKAANGMKTTRLIPNQKLKIPATPAEKPAPVPTPGVQ